MFKLLWSDSAKVDTMSSNKRIAKRSILGTRVCAQYQNGLYSPCSIQAVRSDISGTDYFSLRFDDGFTREAKEKDIVGPGFQNIQSLKLRRGQRCFITYKGRETAGVIQYHRPEIDEVNIEVRGQAGRSVDVRRKLDEIRLQESRKSARLADFDTDYAKMVDVLPEIKKRSNAMDVPCNPRKRSRSPMDRDCAEMEEEEDDEDVEMLDEVAAALVLTRLSCSPANRSDAKYSPKSWTDQYSSSGHSSWSSNPSPPLSESAPSSSVFSSSSVQDEGIDVDGDCHFLLEDTMTPKKRKSPSRTVFQCTWPGCQQIMSACDGIEKHVRNTHLGVADDQRDADHEEEFYYTEIELDMENMADTFSHLDMSSPPPPSSSIYQQQQHNTYTIQRFRSSSMSDHAYQRQHSEPADYRMKPTSPVTIPTPAGTSRSMSWQMPTSFLSHTVAVVTSGSYSSSPKAMSLSLSPKSSSGIHKKSRNEVKKCRKLYGMDNRDMWCTQCRWKKACSRFGD